MKHKTLGQVFTPHSIIVEILDLIGYNDSSILDKYILEPSSGDGAFLLEIVKRYIKIGLNENIGKEDIKKRLEKYIVGVELDCELYLQSIHNLNDLVEKEIGLDNVQWKIYNKNTLYFYTDYINYFDFVVGNPPYIRIHNLDTETKAILKKDFIFSEGTIDIYLSFFEMGLKMLNGNGVLGYITPNSYLHNSSYSLFREHLKNTRYVETLVDFKANKIFKGFSTYTAITILSKKQAKDYFRYYELINENIVNVNKIKFNSLHKKDWSFSNPENELFLSELSKDTNSIINYFFEVQYGFATLRDKLFICTTTPYNDELVLFNNHLIEKTILKTVIKGSRFKGEINENEKIIFPYEKVNNSYTVISETELKGKYPYAYTYLLKNKQELESRDLHKGTLWYEFGRSQGVQNIHNEKIVLSTLVKGKIDYYKLPEDVLMYSGIFIIKKKKTSDWGIIEKTLQSESFYKYIRLTGKDFSGGYKSLTSKQIKEFRIKV